MKTYFYFGLAIAFVVVGALMVVGVIHWGNGRYDAGVTAGKNGVLANAAEAAQRYQQNRDALAAYSAAAGEKLNQTLGTTLPTIQGQTHDTVETIRTVYRDRPVPDGSCSRPDGVQGALDAAVDRANAAAAAPADHMRSDAPAVSGTAGAPPGDSGGHAGR